MDEYPLDFAVKPRPFKNKWHKIKHVYFALLVRETKTTYFTYKLGALWLFLEPMLHVLIFSSIRFVGGTATMAGVSTPFYILTALTGWLGFRRVMSRCPKAIAGNKGLLVFANVRAIDTVFLRFFLESGTMLFVFFLFFIIFYWFGLCREVSNLLGFLCVYYLLALLALGFGLCVEVLSLYFEEVNKMMIPINMGLYFTSGVFFSASQLPPRALAILKYNPILVGVESCKSFVFPDYASPVIDYPYLISCSLIMLILGLRFFQVNLKKFINQ